VKKVSGYDYTWKIMMLGDADAGKISLTLRFISGFFLSDLKLTIGIDFYSKTTNYKEKKIKLQIWDFGGEERFRFLLHQYCKGANAAFFLYNITNPNSLDSLPDWTQIIREHAGDIPILLVGTHVDLVEQRVITRKEGIQAAKRHKLSAFIEVSSKTGQNVEKVFDIITEILFARYKPDPTVVRTKTRTRILPRVKSRPKPKPKPIPISRPLPEIIQRATPSLKSRPNIQKKDSFEFVVNDYITLRLENRRSNIYVGGRIFRQCKYLFLNLSVDKTRDYDEIESIDEAAEFLQSPPGTGSCIPPKTEFWGHCSNIQAWVKFGYDTRILHRNLAFPLLRALVTAGDPKAIKVFKEEIALRLESGYPSVVLYLLNQRYLEYLDKEELDTVLESPKFLKNIPKSILSQLPQWLATIIRRNLKKLT